MFLIFFYCFCFSSIFFLSLFCCALAKHWLFGSRTCTATNWLNNRVYCFADSREMLLNTSFENKTNLPNTHTLAGNTKSTIEYTQYLNPIWKSLYENTMGFCFYRLRVILSTEYERECFSYTVAKWLVAFFYSFFFTVGGEKRCRTVQFIYFGIGEKVAPFRLAFVFVFCFFYYYYYYFMCEKSFAIRKKKQALGRGRALYIIFR